MAKSLLTSISF